MPNLYNKSVPNRMYHQNQIIETEAATIRIPANSSKANSLTMQTMSTRGPFLVISIHIIKTEDLRLNCKRFVRRHLKVIHWSQFARIIFYSLRNKKILLKRFSCS